MLSRRHHRYRSLTRRSAPCAVASACLVAWALSVPLAAAPGAPPASRLYAGMPELFGSAGGSGAPAPTELLDTHHFAWAIAVDCRRSAVADGALSSARDLLLRHLLRPEGIAAPGDLICLYPFGNANLHSETRELSLVSAEYRRQLQALRDCVPGAEAMRRWDTLSARSGQVAAGDALSACARWLAGEYRRGWRHLGLLVLTDDDAGLMAIAGRGPQHTARPYEAADFGLPGGTVHSAYLQETTTGSLACAWLVVSPADADEVDRIGCAAGDRRITSRRELVGASLPRWGALRGTVRGADGRPGPSLWVSAGRGLTAASSPGNGTYEILVPGPGDYVVTVADAARAAAPAFLAAQLGPQALTADGLDFTVRDAPAGARIDGFVVAAAETGARPMTGYARLRVGLLQQGSRTQVQATVTDAQGRYSFAGLAPGGYLVRVAAGDTGRQVSCHVFAGGGRLVAPPVALPVPEPWWPLPAAVAAVALALGLMLRTALKGCSVVVAPAEGNEGNPHQALVGPLSRLVIRDDMGTGDGTLAVVSKGPFGRPRVAAGRGVSLLPADERGLIRRSAPLSSSVVLEVEGRRWRIAAVDTRRRHAIPDPGGALPGDAVGLDLQPAVDPATAAADTRPPEPIPAQARSEPVEEPGVHVARPAEFRPARPVGGAADTDDWEL